MSQFRHQKSRHYIINLTDTGFVSSKGILDAGCQAAAHSCKEIRSFTYPGDASGDSEK